MTKSESLFPTSLFSPSVLAALVVAAALAFAACGEKAADSEAGAEEAAEATSDNAVALGGAPNRAGVPTSGGAALTKKAKKPDAKVAAAGDDKDYWKAIPFQRSDFDEVRKWVKDKYYESKIDEGRSYAEAASFALASDEEMDLVMVPEGFYNARKAMEYEKDRLKGEVLKLKPDDAFILLKRKKETEAEKKEREDKDKKKKYSDDELRKLRAQAKARSKQLDEGWKKVGFSAAHFTRVMDWVAANLGKSKKWSMKRAWVSAAQGYLYSLDPHSSLIPKKAWEDSTAETTDSSFEGIGAILTKPAGNDYTIVESPIEGQPAVKAGLRAGDTIIKVDGKSIKGLILRKVVNRIRGKKGTIVTLTVEREGQGTLDVPIRRSYIDIKNVSGSLMMSAYDDIGYVKIMGFVPTTTLELRRKIAELSSKTKSGRLKGLILDLRRNSGGLLKQGIQVADEFLDKGIIVSVKSRIGREEIHRATDGAEKMPLVVLVNDGSASASEIVASAIQEHGRGLVIGDRTFGKASVQTLFSPQYRDEYYIKLTVARYYSPLGRTLQVVGVQPDMTIAPKMDGKMPLGFREEDLSRHLKPITSKYPEVNASWAKRIEACIKKEKKARIWHKKNPNPAVKFDWQKMYGADALTCMAKQKLTAAK